MSGIIVKEKSKYKIIDNGKAMVLFWKRGYAETGMKDIANT
ncbi:MAG: hypothetical protein ACUVRK_13125 [Spirochaetota bacterium]